jgi:hypothetical protein
MVGNVAIQIRMLGQPPARKTPYVPIGTWSTRKIMYTLAQPTPSGAPPPRPFPPNTSTGARYTAPKDTPGDILNVPEDRWRPSQPSILIVQPVGGLRHNALVRLQPTATPPRLPSIGAGKMPATPSCPCLLSRTAALAPSSWISSDQLVAKQQSVLNSIF